MDQVQHLIEPEAAQHVLISGASFAGLATAWWLRRLGYAVTVVEVAPNLRKGGTPVDIRESVVEVVRRMGLLEAIQAAALPHRPTVFLNDAGIPLEAHAPAPMDSSASSEPEEWEIERDTLLDLLFERLQHDVEFLFVDSITAIRQTPHAVHVTFASGVGRTFALLFGCDGTHSAVRRLCFGPESAFVVFLQNYFSLTILDTLLLPENSAQLFSRPGRTIMLNTYNGKTDIAFCFTSAEEMTYDRRDRTAQKQKITEHFADLGWRVPELLAAMQASENFYFDKLCQVRMDRWSAGRVALVGDAACCPSPAAGMGGSMALLGAAALADALAQHPHNYQAAFRAYDQNLRPVVEQIQRDAVEVGMKLFMPDSEDAILARNEQLHLA